MQIRRIKNAAGYMYWPEDLPGYHEQGEIMFLKGLVKPGMRALDVGAAFGLYSVAVMAHARGSPTVIAIEMDAPTCAVFRKTINAFYPDIELHNVAAWDKNCDVGVGQWVIDGHPDLKCNCVEPDGGGVKAVRLDDYLDNPIFDFVKIDVEGAELKVLAGMEKIIKRSKDMLLLLEMVPDRLRQYGDKLDDLIDFVHGHDFEYLDYGAGDLDALIKKDAVFNAFFRRYGG